MSGEWYDWFTSPQEQFDAKVAELKAKVAEFSRLYNEVLATESTAKSDPELYAEYQKVMYLANIAKAAVEKVTGGVDWVTGFVGEVFNRDAQDVSGLGWLPVVGVAVIVGAISTLGVAIGGMYTYLKHVQFKEVEQIRRNETIQKYMAQGYTLQQAQSAYEGDSTIKQIGTLIAVAGSVIAFIYLLPETKRYLKML
jgi:hypothetical protein